MTDRRPDIWQVADSIQMDLRAAQAKLVELRAMLSAMKVPQSSRRFMNGPVTAPSCPECGVVGHTADCGQRAASKEGDEEIG